jgi:acyl-ACP thioesterase
VSDRLHLVAPILGRFHGVLFLNATLRVTIEHEAPIALGDKLDIIAHVHPPGSTDNFGPGLVDRTITTLTYTAGDETMAIASIFAL